MTYDIALRYDDLGLDDVVVKDVVMFRMERMDDDHVWLACYLEDGQEIVFDLSIDVEGRVIYSVREPLPDVKYESGRESNMPRETGRRKERHSPILRGGTERERE